MALFDESFQKKIDSLSAGKISTPKQPEHAVIIEFKYGIDELDDLFDLEDKLRNIIDNKVGKYDGHEIAMDGSDGVLYMYGPNAEVLFKAILPTLQKTGFMKGAIATLWFGPPGDDAKEIDLEIL